VSSAYERDKHAAQLEDDDDNRRDLARERERATASSRPQECSRCRRDMPCSYGLMTCDERISLYDAGRADLARELMSLATVAALDWDHVDADAAYANKIGPTDDREQMAQVLHAWRKLLEAAARGERA
jgi:hypothetical protein